MEPTAPLTGLDCLDRLLCLLPACSTIRPNTLQALGGGGSIDVELATRQHDGYVAALSKLVDSVEV